MDSSNTFGEWLRTERKRRGLSQTTLGERAGVSQGHISHIERDEEFPSCELAILLAGALGLPQVVGAIEAGYITDLSPEVAALAAEVEQLPEVERRLVLAAMGGMVGALRGRRERSE